MGPKLRLVRDLSTCISRHPVRPDFQGFNLPLDANIEDFGETVHTRSDKKYAEKYKLFML